MSRTTELLRGSGGGGEQLEEQTRPLASSSSTFTSSSSSKLSKISQVVSTTEERSGVQRRTSPASESFRQVQKSPQIPEGESVPDFEERLRPITAQEGDKAVFKAKVTGSPQPSVSWERASGLPLPDASTPFYDDINSQHILKIKRVSLKDADVYKCTASNQHGEAAYSASLVVTENPALDFKKMLKKRGGERRREERKPPTEEEMLKILAGADKKDYERICAEYGFTDFRGILKKLKEMKKKVEVEMVRVLKPLEDVTAKAGADVAFDTVLELKDPNIRMQWFLGAEPLRIRFSLGKYEVKQVGTKHVLRVASVGPGDAGTYTLQVGGERLSAKLRVTDEPLKFLSDFKPKTVTERQTAAFEVRLSKKTDAPLVWKVRGKEVKRDEKFDVSVSEDGLTYTLKVKDVKASDAGDYTVCIGDLSATVPLYIERIPITFTAQLKSARVQERGTARLECEMSSKEARVRWLKDGRDITASGRYVFAREGRRAEVVIEDCELTDEGEYSAVCSQENDGRTYVTSASVFVDERFASVKSGMSDAQCPTGSATELCVVLDDEKVDGAWLKDGVEVSELSGVQVAKQGAVHKLIFSGVSDAHEGRYTFRTKGAESEAVLTIADPPAIDSSVLDSLAARPVTVKAGQTATIKIPFNGRPTPRVTWYKDGVEVTEDDRTKVEKTADSASLVLSRCVREDSCAIMLRLKSHCGSAVASLQLSVIDRPKPPQGKVEFLESSARRIRMRWKAPRDDGGEPVTGYVIERRPAGKRSWTRVGEAESGTAAFSDEQTDEGQAYQYRIRAVNAEGASEPLQTEEVRAGEPIEPPGPAAQPQVSSITKHSMTVSWTPPAHDGGAPVLGYVLERRKKGSSVWLQVSKDLLTDTSYSVGGLVSEVEYEFRVTGVSRAGAGSPSSASNPALAKDPTQAPGLVRDLCVSDSTSSSISLRWAPSERGDEPSGYILEFRPEGAKEWTKASKIPIAATAFTVGGLQERTRYHFRVRAVNEGGLGEPTELLEGALAMPPPVAPRFELQGKLRTRRVVRAGAALCLHFAFTASPPPVVNWFKAGVPTTGREVVTSSRSHSQFLISSCQRSDSGVYRVSLKNDCGEAHCEVDVQVTDLPRPPGNLRLDEEVPGTATLQWDHTPDLADGDEGTHYVILKRDTSTTSWFTVAERVFSSKYTVTGLLPGRRYYFRVIAQNTTGDSEPLDSKEPLVIAKEKDCISSLQLERFSSAPRRVKPTFLLPLKDHAVRKGHDCTMSCAYQGMPPPQACWYKADSKISDSPRLWHSTAGGVCTLVIPTCGAKDGGRYTLVLENPLGKTQCSCHLVIFDKEGLLDDVSNQANKEKLIL